MHEIVHKNGKRLHDELVSVGDCGLVSLFEGKEAIGVGGGG
jgi:hypothetical protein